MNILEEAAAACKARRTGEGQFIGHCPAHEDTTASLSIGPGETQPVVVRCHAGCDQDDVLSAFKAKYGLDLRGRGDRGRKHTTGVGGANGSSGAGADFMPIIPPPEEPSIDELRRGPGELVAAFAYRNATAQLEGYVRRFNLVEADGKANKVFLPLRYGTPTICVVTRCARQACSFRPIRRSRRCACAGISRLSRRRAAAMATPGGF